MPRLLDMANGDAFGRIGPGHMVGLDFPLAFELNQDKRKLNSALLYPFNDVGKRGEVLFHEACACAHELHRPHRCGFEISQNCAHRTRIDKYRPASKREVAQIEPLVLVGPLSPFVGHLTQCAVGGGVGRNMSSQSLMHEVPCAGQVVNMC